MDENKPSNADELLTIESSIKQHMPQIEKLGEELKPVKEMLEDMGVKINLDIKKIVKHRTGKSC